MCDIAILPQMGTLDWTTHQGKQLVIKHRIPEASRQQAGKPCRPDRDGYIRGKIDQRNNEFEGEISSDALDYSPQSTAYSGVRV